MAIFTLPMVNDLMGVRLWLQLLNTKVDDELYTDLEKIMKEEYYAYLTKKYFTGGLGDQVVIFFILPFFIIMFSL